MSGLPKKTGGMQKRSAARLAAVQALYQQEQLQCSAQDVYTDFMNHRLYQIDLEENIPFDPSLFRAILFLACDQNERVEAIISEHLVSSWSYNRLEVVLRSILRAAVAEFLMDKVLPAAIIINEYVNVTRGFYEGREAQFVNGILDKIARSLGVSMKNDDASNKKIIKPEQVKKDDNTSGIPSWRDEGGA